MNRNYSILVKAACILAFTASVLPLNAAPTPRRGVLIEDFFPIGEIMELDFAGSNGESIQRTGGSLNNFAWGGGRRQPPNWTNWAASFLREGRALPIPGLTLGR